jgi:hypothetical protein
VLETVRVPGWPARVFQVWMGEGEYIIVFPLGAGELLKLRLLRPGGGGDARVWSAPGDPDALRAANQSIEDAFALAAVVGDASRAEVPAALPDYAKVRRRRTDVVQANSRTNGQRYDTVNRTADGRDRELMDARTLRAWIYDYDVEADPGLTSWTGGNAGG